jgi:hypothetical protein
MAARSRSQVRHDASFKEQEFVTALSPTLAADDKPLRAALHEALKHAIRRLQVWLYPAFCSIPSLLSRGFNLARYAIIAITLTLGILGMIKYGNIFPQSNFPLGFGQVVSYPTLLPNSKSRIFQMNAESQLCNYEWPAIILPFCQTSVFRSNAPKSPATLSILTYGKDDDKFNSTGSILAATAPSLTALMKLNSVDLGVNEARAIEFGQARISIAIFQLRAVYENSKAETMVTPKFKELESLLKGFRRSWEDHYMGVIHSIPDWVGQLKGCSSTMLKYHERQTRELPRKQERNINEHFPQRLLHTIYNTILFSTSSDPIITQYIYLLKALSSSIHSTNCPG